MEKVLEILTRKEVIFAMVVILVLFIIWFIVRKVKIKNCKAQLSELEIRYNSIKSVPLPFKLNKAVAIARVNQETMAQVTHCKDDFELAQANLKQIAQMLADTEDMVLVGKLKDARINLDDLDNMMELGEEQVHQLEAFLDKILEKETAQRAEVTQMKEEFRTLKLQAQEKSAQLSFCWETIENRIAATEKMFSAFEEWMYASEFEKASEELVEISEALGDLTDIINNLPQLLQEARGLIPNLIDEVSRSYSMQKQKGVYLHHLEVPRNLEVISETLKEDLAALKQGTAVHIRAHLDEDKKRLSQLLAQIEKEGQSYDEMRQAEEKAEKTVLQLKENSQYVRQLMAKVSVRFGIEDLSDQIKLREQRIIEIEDMRVKIMQMIKGTSVPASTILISLKELQQEADAVLTEVNQLKARLDSACSDEARGKKQLLKLQLIMNEMQVKIRKNKLPAISATYEGDLARAVEYVRSIEDLLTDTPLNVQLMNATLNDAIDYIYKLYNNVNNLVAMAIMVENTIVFGNKYRSTYPDIDSELTRAELCFRNGEYTQALTVALATIERIHPGSYEKLIKENAQSAA